jgi:hypothetical protein
MLDLIIKELRLNMDNAAGHEHRLQPIAARAAVVFATRLHERWADGQGYLSSGSLDSLSAAPLNFNLNDMSDEEAAEAIASTWINALALKLKL